MPSIKYQISYQSRNILNTLLYEQLWDQLGAGLNSLIENRIRSHIYAQLRERPDAHVSAQLRKDHA